MTSLRAYIIIPLITIAYISNAQTGSLAGKVIDDSSRFLSNAIIHLKGTSHHTISKEDGSYKIENIKPGTYKLTCTGICNNTVEKKVEIEGDKETHLDIQVHHKLKEMDEVVITATRTEKDMADVPMPIKVITGEQIRQMGSLRLNEVLMEQTGLAIVSDHGTGIQLQGFNPEYTLILIDGEPLIGRTAGTLDLTRIAIGNIKRIEIVKGPSSSLYGSEALAGVINIITEKPKESFLGNLKTRYGTNNTLDLTADTYLRFKKLGIYAFGNRYSTLGYDLQPESEDKTVAPFNNYTFQSKLTYTFSPRVDLSLSGRYFTEAFNTIMTFTENNIFYRINDKGGQYDWNLNPVLTYRMSDRNKLITRFYSTYFHTNDLMTNTSDGSLYDQSFFNQSFNRPEMQFDHLWKKNQQTTVGAGTIFESVDATRYTDKKYFHNIYGYAQHDFTILKRLNIIAGVRFDAHSVYGSQISPKLSSKLKITDWLSLRASVGKGFKAPDFRQLYLNFTNPVAGYSVFGSEEVSFQIDKMQQQGGISQILIDPTSLQPIKAESSTAYNLGWILQPTKKITWQVNFFRNDIVNMIETAPIAIKTNGQSVYSYFNLSSVYTQGLETDISYKLSKSLTFSAGYQYLEAKNKAVISDIEDGKYFTRDPNTLATKRLTVEDYGGLFNRSKHMANVKLFYMNKKGWGGNIRGIYRGRYGYGDLNGNLILDDDREYINGYWIWNVAVSKKIFNTLTIQGGIDNVFGFINAQYIPSVPGRLYYMSLNMNLNKEVLKK